MRCLGSFTLSLRWLLTWRECLIPHRALGQTDFISSIEDPESSSGLAYSLDVAVELFLLSFPKTHMTHGSSKSAQLSLKVQFASRIARISATAGTSMGRLHMCRRTVRPAASVIRTKCPRKNNAKFVNRTGYRKMSLPSMDGSCI